MRSIHSNGGLSKKVIINQVIKEMPAEIDLTEREIDQLYNLSIECRNNSLSQEELINKISKLRGRGFFYRYSCGSWSNWCDNNLNNERGFSISTQSECDYSTSFAMVMWESVA